MNLSCKIIALSVLSLMTLRAPAQVQAPETFTIKGPTIIAFISTAYARRADTSTDVSVEYQQFEFKNNFMTRPCKNSGIDFYDVKTDAFNIQDNESS